MSHPFGIRVALASALILVFAGCGASTGSPASATPRATASAASPAGSTPASGPATASATIAPSTGPSGATAPSPSVAGTPVALEVAVAAVGSFLTGKDGRTLYTFVHDSPGGSTCNLDCAKSWPPFIVAAGERLVVGPGATGPVDLVTRADGTKQVKYQGSPLSFFSGDAKAGDPRGQGSGGVWSIARP